MDTYGQCATREARIRQTQRWLGATYAPWDGSPSTIAPEEIPDPAVVACEACLLAQMLAAGVAVQVDYRSAEFARAVAEAMAPADLARLHFGAHEAIKDAIRQRKLAG